MAVGWTIGAFSGGEFEPGGELRSGRAWSTMKVPVIVASITAGRADWHDDRGRDHALGQRRGSAASGTRSTTGPREVEAVLRRAGDSVTTLEREADPRGWSSFGRTVWSLQAAAAFYRALATGELLARADTERILDAMGRDRAGAALGARRRCPGCASRAAGGRARSPADRTRSSRSASQTAP